MMYKQKTAGTTTQEKEKQTFPILFELCMGCKWIASYFIAKLGRVRADCFLPSVHVVSVTVKVVVLSDGTSGSLLGTCIER
jgi:hypothetical protein